MGDIISEILQVSGVLHPYLPLGDLVVPRAHVMMPTQGKLDGDIVPDHVPIDQEHFAIIREYFPERFYPWINFFPEAPDKAVDLLSDPDFRAVFIHRSPLAISGPPPYLSFCKILFIPS
jgi:hypothetical protein